MRELESSRTVAKNKARKKDIVFLIMYIPPPPPILQGHGHRVLYHPLEIASHLPSQVKNSTPAQEEGPPRRDVAASPVERHSRRPLGDSGSLYIIIIKNSVLNVIWVCPFICELDVIQRMGRTENKTELL